MKTVLLTAFFISVLTTACNKQKDLLTESLDRRWQVYSIKILKLDDSNNSGACLYKTSVSDFYDPPSIQPCQADDVYDFTNEKELTIYTGSIKCTVNEANSITKTYERKGDSLFINGTGYYIVHLSTDTLILDYCTDMNIYSPMPVINKAKVGIKFIRTD